MPSPDFANPNGEAILAQMIQTVVTAEELPVGEGEEEEAEEEERAYEPLGPGRKPSLKVLFVETRAPVKDFVDRLFASAPSSQRLQNLLNSYQIELTPKGEGYWLLVFKERQRGRPTCFLIVVKERTWEVYTVERAKEVGRTFRRMVEESEFLDMAWMPREQLDRIVEELISPAAVAGFTARRRTRWSPKRVTVRVYGGDRRDLEVARQYFKSEPTAIYFLKTHSPEVAIQGTVAADGELRIDRIAPNAIDDFNRTETGVFHRFIDQEYDKILGSYPEGISSQLGSLTLRDSNGLFLGEMSKGFHAVVFSIPEKYWSGQLEQAIRDVFVKGSEGTFSGYELSPSMFRTFDRDFGGAFSIRMDRETLTVVVDPLSGTTEKSISALARVFLDRIEHSAKVEAVHQVFR